MYLLDTDILTLLFRDHARILERIGALEPGTLVAISIISRIQMLRGRFESVLKASSKDEWLHSQVWLEDTERRLARRRVIQINEAAADQFEVLLTGKKPRKMDRADLLIASIALANKATLVTRNVKDFKLVPGLKIENWAD